MWSYLEIKSVIDNSGKWSQTEGDNPFWPVSSSESKEGPGASVYRTQSKTLGENSMPTGCVPGTEGAPNADLAGTLTLDFPSVEHWENTLCDVAYSQPEMVL